jgi:hypothetical protein
MPTQRLVTAAPPPQQGQAPRMTPFDTSQFDNTVGGSIDSVRGEVDDAFADMATLHNLEPDEGMRITSGHSARLSFIRVKILRVEDFKREWKNVRVREIEPAIEELREQWKNASRLHSVRELDWKMEAGER